MFSRQHIFDYVKKCGMWVETLDRLVFELRKHKGFELTVFLEAFWKEHLSTQLKCEAIESLSWRKA